MPVMLKSAMWAAMNLECIGVKLTPAAMVGNSFVDQML